MTSNLLWPWVLARLVLGASTALLCSFALAAVRRGRGAQADPDAPASEARLESERRAELASAVVRVAAVFGALALALTVFAADGLSHAVRGAMCAWGVFESGDGFYALGTSALLTVSAGAWLALHRHDLDLERPTLTPRKLAALAPLTALAWIDLAAHVTFFYRLDLGTAASCCSAGLDALRVEWMPGSDALLRGPAALAATGLCALATGLCVRTLRSPSRARARAAGAATVLASLGAWPAVLWYVAPHVYETPHHNCPFCLLHADAWGVGWLLFGALIWAAIDGVSLVVVQRLSPAAEPQITLGNLARLARHATWALGLAWLTGLAPVVRYAVVTGGASLF